MADSSNMAAALSLAGAAAKRGLVHRIKKMLKPVARLVGRSKGKSNKCHQPQPQPQQPEPLSVPVAPSEADLDNLANEALERKLALDCGAAGDNAENEARDRLWLLAAAAETSTPRVPAAAAACCRALRWVADGDVRPPAATLCRGLRAEVQRS